MQAGHPSKTHVRGAWLEEVLYRAKQSNKATRVLYLTLCGRHAIDIQMLVDAGVIKLLENGAVDLDNSRKVVAFEVDAPSATEIKRRFPGLNVLEMNIHDELKLSSPLNFPAGPKRQNFEASVINLDYDRAVRISDGQLLPVRAVAKIAQIQEAKKLPWSLLLTLNASNNWSEADQKIEKEFLANCFDHCPEAAAWLGEHGSGGDPLSIALDSASKEIAQAFQLVLVCARLGEALATHGWRITVEKAFSYGNQDQRAPMVSWIVRLAHHPDGNRRRNEFTTESLKSLIASARSLAHLDD